MIVNLKPYDEPSVKDITIEDSDTWSLDYTLALIIHPALVKFKESINGSPYVTPEDVPEELKPKEEPCEANNFVDDTHHQRWEWVVTEMIWAFDNIINPKDEEYHTGEVDLEFQKIIGTSFSKMVEGPNHTHKVDEVGLKAYEDRISNGLRLFGKYYKSLWS
jgi:hypothetical protein